MSISRDPRRCLRVEFVCTGNICRSPVAAKVVAARLREAGVADGVEIVSSGVGHWHVGEPMDRRAAASLRERGYDHDHTARQADRDTLAADLLIAATESHAADLRAAGADPERVRLLRSFDPEATPGAELPDPYYGGPRGFDDVLDMVEAAAPGVVAWIQARL